MSRTFSFIFLLIGFVTLQKVSGQDRYMWEKALDIVAGYGKFIASGGNYDTIAAAEMNKLIYSALSKYYPADLGKENFARNHLLAIKSYQDNELTEAIRYAHMALRWATKIQDKYCKAAAQRILSDYYHINERYDSALHYKMQALAIYQQLKNDPLANLMSYQIGNLYFDVEDYDQAEVFIKEFLAKDKRTEPNHTLRAYNRLGRIYSFRGKYSTAVGYFEQAALLAKQYDRQQWYTTSKGNIGKAFFKQGRYFEAIPLLEMSYLSAIEQRDTSRAVVEAATIAEIYFKLGNTQQMAAFMQQVNLLAPANSLTKEAKISYARANYLQAKAGGQWQRALKLHEDYKHLSDSLNRFDIQKKLEQIREVNAAAVQEVAAQLVAKKAEAAENERNILQISRAIFAAVVVPLLFFLVRLNRKRQKMNQILERRKEEIKQKNILLEEQNQKVAQQAAILEQTVKERTRDLESTIKVLNSQHKDLQQFSYTISHNIRSPVAQIMGLVNVMNLNSPNDPLNTEILENLYKAASNLDQVIRDLNLIISTKHGLETLREKTDLESLMRQVLAGLESNIAHANASIQYDFTLQPVLHTVRGYIHSILHNLISNAIKYRSDKRAPHIAVSADLLGDFCSISVADNGLGIDLENTDSYKIFGLYQRMHTHTEGKGMGLYLVKTQVESLGGTITVESKLGIGTVFKVLLPLR
ncbi:ATP-binding protein [Rhodoflexus sp.]